MDKNYDTIVRGILVHDPNHPEDEEKIKAGLRELVRYAWRHGEYCDSNTDLFNSIVALGSHPFTDSKISTYLMGNIGVTYSIAPFLHSLSHELDYLEELRLWFFEQPDIEGAHQIVAEFCTVGQNYLCSGLTDFSGTGGHGFGKIKSVFKAVSYMTSVVYTELLWKEPCDVDLILSRYVDEGTEVVFSGDLQMSDLW